MDKKELELAKKRICDPLWRLNNLYWIVNKEGQKVKFTLNWAQKELYDNMHYMNVVLKARQLGISTFVCILFLDRCLFNSNVSAGILAHTQEDAAHMFKRVKFAYDSLDDNLRGLIVATNDSARELTFSNGSSLRVGTSMRGSTFQYLLISEFGKICAQTPEKAREIITGTLNTLAAGQYCFVESTAEGREGHFYEMCKQAQGQQESKIPLTKLDFQFHFFPWWRCPEYSIEQPVTIPKDLDDYFTSLKSEGIKLSSGQKYWYVKKHQSQQDDMKREYPSTPDESFQTAIDGAYFAKQLSAIRMNGQITRITYSKDLPVHTTWDIGYGDSTAIWLFQLEGKEIHFLEYIEGAMEPLHHYIKILKERPYIYGLHIVPHDARNHEYGSGLTRIEIAAKLGFNFTLSADVSLDEGIDASRNLLERCWFDEAKCAKGISHLSNYRRSWNTSLGCWASHPVHNAASHAADALRMLAVSMGRFNEEEITQEKYDKLYEYYRPRFG